MPDVLAAADRQAPASPPGELGGWEGYVGGAAPQHTEAIVHIHWGICTWVPGQLDGASHNLAPLYLSFLPRPGSGACPESQVL